MPSQGSEAISVTPIYSFTALKSKQREVKDRGKQEVVHITENGNAAFVFCSEEVFEREKANAVAAAIQELDIAALVERGRADVKAGRTVAGLEAARVRMHGAWGRDD